MTAMSSFNRWPIRLQRVVLPEAVPPVTPMKIGLTSPELTSWVSMRGSSALVAGSENEAAICYIVFCRAVIKFNLAIIIKLKNAKMIIPVRCFTCGKVSGIASDAPGHGQQVEQIPRPH